MEGLNTINQILKKPQVEFPSMPKQSLNYFEITYNNDKKNIFSYGEDSLFFCTDAKVISFTLLDANDDSAKIIGIQNLAKLEKKGGGLK